MLRNKLAKPHNTTHSYAIYNNRNKNRSRWNKNEWIRWSNKTNTTRYDDPTSLYIIRTYIILYNTDVKETTVLTTTIASHHHTIVNKKRKNLALRQKAWLIRFFFISDLEEFRSSAWLFHPEIESRTNISAIIHYCTKVFQSRVDSWADLTSSSSKRVKEVCSISQ